MKSPLFAIAAATVVVAAIVGMLVWLGVDEQLISFLRWIEGQGVWSRLWFMLVMALAVVFLLPGVLLTTGAGFVFGVVEGTVNVVLGTTLGACVSFLLARYVAGERARAFLLRHSQLRDVTAEMQRHDLQVVLLTRLIPFFPGKLSNYVFGLSGFRFQGFTLGTFIGLIPFSLHNVYLGSIAASLVSVDERGFGRTRVEWAVYLCGFLASIVAVVYLNRIAQRGLARYREESRETRG